MLPNLKAGQAYRVFAPDAYPRIKDIVERTVTSGLIYLPSSVKDFANPEIEPYLRQYVRGSHGIEHHERIKIMKLLWDCDRHRIRRPARTIRTQLRRRVGGYSRSDADRRGEGRRYGEDGGAGRSVHGRIRRDRLDRRDLDVKIDRA